MAVRVALISGPMYDALYARLPEFTRVTGIAVEIAFQGDHPALNEFLATETAAACVLVSTHTKYAPSQQTLLAPLDGLFSAAKLADFTPQLLDLARMRGSQYSLPRNVDVRLLHYRTDIIAQAPATWKELLDLARTATLAELEKAH